MLGICLQARAVEGFLHVLQKYCTESLCNNLRAHTITNVQSNNDKVNPSIRFFPPILNVGCTAYFISIFSLFNISAI